MWLLACLLACVHACIAPTCVRAQRTRVHARVWMHACARRRRIAEPSRTVQQAQAARRAGEAAKKKKFFYSSRDLRAEERQRSVGSPASTVRAASAGHTALSLPLLRMLHEMCCVFIYFIFFFLLSSFCLFPCLHLGSPGRTRARISVVKSRQDERKRKSDTETWEKCRIKKKILLLLLLVHLLPLSSFFFFLRRRGKMCTSFKKGCVPIQCEGTRASASLTGFSCFSHFYYFYFYFFLLRTGACPRALYVIFIY